MYGIHIEYAALFYGEVRRREVIHIDEQLRALTFECARKMHDAWSRRYLPKANKKPRCKKCSLVDICLPELEQRPSVSDYLKRNLYEETT
jgi:CRISPR-associated exonuclease Cas4